MTVSELLLGGLDSCICSLKTGYRISQEPTLLRQAARFPENPANQQPSESLAGDKDPRPNPVNLQCLQRPNALKCAWLLINANDVSPQSSTSKVYHAAKKTKHHPPYRQPDPARPLFFMHFGAPNTLYKNCIGKADISATCNATCNAI